MKKVISLLKSDAVLSAAWGLALLSAFFVKPDRAYLSYIDFRSLGILWSLMVIMQVFKENGVFSAIGEKVLSKTGKIGQLATVLVLLPFFTSMLITNDVALITFVPFSVLILSRCRKKELLIPVVVLQTVAANLGSMMTPVGNPQNLYLYGLSGMGIGEFTLLLLPYTALSLVLLVLSVLFLKGKNEPVVLGEERGEKAETPDRKLLLVYTALFLAALLCVARILPWQALFAAVLLVTFLMQKEFLRKADYGLLLTFVGFFIFTGNMGRMDAVSTMLSRLVSGREFAVGILTSQVISNVPAALLLSGFTDDLRELILGVNVGGLGTLIASMASLISWKQVALEPGTDKKKYFLLFTAVNVLFLAALCVLHAMLS